MCRFFIIIIMANFSIPNSILMSWLYIVTACGIIPMKIIMVITHLSGKYLSRFSSPLDFFLLLSVPMSRFYGFLDELYITSVGILFILSTHYPSLQGHIVCFSVINLRHSNIFHLFFLSLRMCWPVYTLTRISSGYMLFSVITLVYVYLI